MTYLEILKQIQFVAVVVYVPVVGWPRLLPRPLKCNCTLLRFHPHPVTSLLLVGCILAGVICVIDIYRAFFEEPWWIISAVLYAAWAYFLHKWWKRHKKGGKQGSLAKLLARVRVTAAGLRVVPVKGN